MRKTRPCEPRSSAASRGGGAFRARASSSACSKRPSRAGADAVAAGVAFHAHATGTLGDHAWTEGVESFGIEFQGWFDYSYQSNYAGFDFCTWNTDPHEFYYTIGEDPPAKPDPTAE